MTEDEIKTMMEEARGLYLRCQLDRAFPLFKKCAEEGNGEAMYFLGEYYTQGYGHTKQDLEKGAEWRSRGAAAGNPLARLNEIYSLNPGDSRIGPMAAKVFPEILARAEGGDIFAQNELADMYLYGIGIEKDAEKGIHWLETAAEKNFWRPLNKLGEVYYYGQGMDEDRKRAQEYFEKAAAMGYGDGEANLAMCCYTAEKRNMPRAVSLLRRAFAHGAFFAAEAAHILGLIIYEGDGVKKDDREAFEWMRRSARMGSPDGMNILSIFYEQGIGTAPDGEKSRDWCRRAADGGQGEAAVRYGMMLQEKHRMKEAMKYFRKAAEAGVPEGQAWLGSYYLYGIAVKKNPEEARRWLEEAAAQDEENAKRLLKEHFSGGKAETAE